MIFWRLGTWKLKFGKSKKRAWEKHFLSITVEIESGVGGNKRIQLLGVRKRKAESRKKKSAFVGLKELAEDHLILICRSDFGFRIRCRKCSHTREIRALSYSFLFVLCNLKERFMYVALVCTCMFVPLLLSVKNPIWIFYSTVEGNGANLELGRGAPTKNCREWITPNAEFVELRLESKSLSTVDLALLKMRFWIKYTHILYVEIRFWISKSFLFIYYYFSCRWDWSH